jgi:hypothetical protein
MQRLGTMLLGLVLASTAAIAADEGVTGADLRERLEVRGEIFLMDASGKKILYTQSVGELRRNVWRPSRNGKIESDWGNNSSKFGHVILRHHWEPQDDGTIHVLVEEYGSEDRVKPDSDETEMRGLLQRKEFVLENFAPIVWKVKNAGTKNVIVRLIPSLREKPETIEIGKLPLANRNVIITDDKGFLWADNVGLDDDFVALTTHRGTLAFSFQPFPGGKEVGFAEEDKMSLTLADGLKVSIKGDSFFVPTGLRAKVFGAYLADKRSTSVHSVHSYGTTDGEHFWQYLNP